MVLPDLMETEENLIDYVKLKNIEGKVSIKNPWKHDDIKEDKNERFDENPMPIESNTEEEKLEFGNLDDATSNLEQESPVNDDNKCDEKTSECNEEIKNKRKGILKYERTYSNKHVDFNMDLEFVPFDETKDYTIEIQIVEQMPKKIVSYAALFAQQKKEEEERLKKEAEEKEKQNRKHNKKRKYYEWKKILKQDKHNTPLQDVEYGSSQLTEKNVVENVLSTEDEMENEKEDYSYSDTDREEHSDTISTESESYLSVKDNSSETQSGGPIFETKTSIDNLNKVLDDTETGADIMYHNELLESKSVMSVEDNTLKNQSDKPKFESIIQIGNWNKPLNSTKTAESGLGIKEVSRNELLDNKCQNSLIVQGINKSCQSSIVPENISDKTQLFRLPAKKQRSNSLSDLGDFKKINRFFVRRLPREIELIVSKQLEKQYHE